MAHVCSPGHKGHYDLTSSPPSSGLSPAVSHESPTKCWQHATGVALVAGLNPTSHDTSGRQPCTNSAPHHHTRRQPCPTCDPAPKGSRVSTAVRNMSSPGKVLRVASN